MNSLTEIKQEIKISNFKCQCGSIICKRTKAKHELSQKHKKFMSESAAKSCVVIHSSSCQAAENCEAEMLSLGVIS